MRKFVAVVAVVTVVVLAAGCGGGGDGEPGGSPSGVATGIPTVVVTPRPTVVATASPVLTVEVPSTQVAGDDPRVVEAVVSDGFAEFAVEFETAIEGNDLEFVLQLAEYEEFACRDGGGLPVGPRSCLLQPVELVVPAISYGIWNSEGGYYSPEEYAEFVVAGLDRKAAPDAYVYALGHHVRGASEDDGGVDIVVADVGGSSAVGAAIVFRAAIVEGEWRIVGVKVARADQVDSFFEWWVPWREVFPEVSRTLLRAEGICLPA